MSRILSRVGLLVSACLCGVAYTNCAPGFSQKADTIASSSNTNGSSTNTGTPNGPALPASTPPTATPPPIDAGKVGVFMAAGHMGRTVISCDDGRTWIKDRSANDATRCWVDGDPNYVECDHTPYSATRSAVEIGDGYFYTAYGWGYDGLIRRSKDGVNWETIKSASSGGGVMFSNGILFALRTDGWNYSEDHGTTWKTASAPGIARDDFDNPIPYRAGTKMFVIGRATGGPQAAVSSDNGKSWRMTSGFNNTGVSIAEGNGVIVGIGDRAGVVGRSLDGGVTWTNATIPGATELWTSNLLFNGTSFIVWAGSKKWTSTDGLTWTGTLSKAPWYEGQVSYSPSTRTYVAILDTWDNFYAKQFAYRSADGENWSTLDAQHFKGGHPIHRIIFGEMDASACQ